MMSTPTGHALLSWILFAAVALQGMTETVAGAVQIDPPQLDRAKPLVTVPEQHQALRALAELVASLVVRSYSLAEVPAWMIPI